LRAEETEDGGQRTQRSASLNRAVERDRADASSQLHTGLAPESDDNLRLESSHVPVHRHCRLLETLLNEEQKERLNQLIVIVLATATVEATDEQLVRLPTGDGMATSFAASAEEPARQFEIAEALQNHPELPIRMGIHSGPVSDAADVGGRTNVMERASTWHNG